VTAVTPVTALCRGLRCRACGRAIDEAGRKARAGLRLAKILRQEDMCQFGFEYKYYQRIEYGQKNLSLKTLKKLAKAFRIPISQLSEVQLIAANNCV
jgi:transcriptional regulator with XRE-family HTH domain